MKQIIILILTIVMLNLSIPGSAAEPANNYIITIKDHRFEPRKLEVPSNTKIKITVKNLDTTPEEFESYDLDRDEKIMGGKQIELYLGPLEPGTYKFIGEFNPRTARGKLIVK